MERASRVVAVAPYRCVILFLVGIRVKKKKKTRKSTPVSGGGEEGCCRGIPVTFLFSRGENEPFFREEDAVSSSVVLACVKYCDLIKREICRFRPRVCIHSRRGDLTDTFLPRYYYHRDRPYI